MKIKSHENVHFLLTLWSHLWKLPYDHNSEEENCYMHIIRNTKLKYLIYKSTDRTLKGWQATRAPICTSSQGAYEGGHCPDILKSSVWLNKISCQSPGVTKARKPTWKKHRLDLNPGMPLGCGRDGLWSMAPCAITSLGFRDTVRLLSRGPIWDPKTTDAERASSA